MDFTKITDEQVRAAMLTEYKAKKIQEQADAKTVAFEDEWETKKQVLRAKHDAEIIALGKDKEAAKALI